MQVKGIDVSKYQGLVDWNKAFKDGVRYAMIRAVSSNKTGLYVDPYLVKNVTNANKAGIHVGVYIYTYATTVEQAKKEIKFLMNAIKGLNIELPVAYDMEYEPGILALTKAQRTAVAKAALEAIENAGYYAMIYCSADFYKNYLNYKELSAYDLWVAQWGNKYSVPVTPGIWQYSNTGSVNGVVGNVDLDYFHKDYPAIIKSAGLNGFAKGTQTPTGNVIKVGPMSKGDFDRVYNTVKTMVDDLGNIGLEVLTE